MHKVLSQNDIERYQEEGFVPVVYFMSEDEATHYKQLLEIAERDHADHVNPEKRNNAHICFTFLDEITHHPRIVAAVEDLIGPGLSLWASVLFIKKPSSRHLVSWHQETTYMGMSNSDFVTSWLALSPSNLTSGCMSMISGSHKNHIRAHNDKYGEDNILTRGQEVEGIDESAGFDLILRPGQMSLHHGEVVHGSRPNTSDQRRIGFALHAYLRPDVIQLKGANYWLDIQGANDQGPKSVSLPHPIVDAHPGSTKLRDMVDDNLQSILYDGAEQRRAY